MNIACDTSSSGIRQTWVSYPDKRPPLGQIVEILVDINAAQSWSYHAVAGLDPVTKEPRWLHPISSKPIGGFRRVTHWRKV